MTVRPFALTTFALAALTIPLASQGLPPVSDSQAAAGLRVATATLSPEIINASRGDTITISAKFFDASGNPVPDVMALVIPITQHLVPIAPPLGAGPFVYVANEPGEAQVFALVRVPDDQGGWEPVPGQELKGIVQVGMIPATIREAEVASIEIEGPTYTAYAGTNFKLIATAFTASGNEHETPGITWTSNNPDVARVSAGGVLSPLSPGNAVLVASAENGVSATLTVDVVANPVTGLSMEPTSVLTRTGDVVHFDVNATDANGRAVPDIALSYSVFALDSAGADVFEDGTFVAENEGAYRVTVSSGNYSANAIVDATRRPKPTPVEVVGRGPVSHVTTSDLWVFEGVDGRDYAYTGTHAQGGGERMFAWDVTDPENIVLTDSVNVDARVVNDVKVNAAGTWAIITREGASSRRNGIVVLDLADPAHPTIIAELTDEMTAGIHNVWINGDIVYAINDGTAALNILDLSDPADPKHAGVWDLRPGDTNKSLHDVWSDGEYAYVSYWDDGLVILDVGAGTHGGTPTEPQFVSSIAYAMGQTHVAWREGKYVFVGDEIMGCEDCTNGPRGYIHVIDVEDIDNPKEVARFEVPEAGTHNIWVEDGTLYIAYYQGGLRIVDVTGDLRGDLYAQGRQIGWVQTPGAEGEAITPNTTMAWGPQPYKGYIFISDMNSGLWAVRHVRPERLTP